ncbi:MAG: WYL domain-containing protein [Cardiobacteriaceae bacterium]|nr:WYL domain-containing protein [Cardiobacteriaceae bacterium]
MNLITTAINDKKIIHFSYTDRNGFRTKRTVKPQEIEYRHRIPCMNAFCHLRQDYRTFIIRRMTDIEIIE